MGKRDTKGLEAFPKVLWKVSWLLMSLEGVSESLPIVKNVTWHSPVYCDGDFKAERKFFFANGCYRDSSGVWPFSLCCFYAITSFQF